MVTIDSVREKIQEHFPKEKFELKFKRIAADVLLSECGRFYVGRVTLNDHTLYETWFKADKGSGAISLRQNLPSAEEAKAWVSSIADAYQRGHLSLKAPPTREEIADLERVRKAG